MPVSCERCVLSGKVSVVQRSTTECGVSGCECEALIMGETKPLGTVAP